MIMTTTMTTTNNYKDCDDDNDNNNNYYYYYDALVKPHQEMEALCKFFNNYGTVNEL